MNPTLRSDSHPMIRRMIPRMTPRIHASFLLRAFLPLGLVAGLAACATGFTSSSVEDFGSFRVEVTNDLAPRVQIYLQRDPSNGSEAASERLLGGAPVEGTTVFRLDLDDRSTTLRLRAALPRNRELLSETFVAGESGGVRWVLAGNQLSESTSGAVEGNGAESQSGEAMRESPASDHRRPTGARRIPPGS